MTNLKAIVSGRGARRARRGHPWIYRDDVISAEGQAGEIVQVLDRDGRFCCQAIYSPQSRITLRRISRLAEPLDEDYFTQALIQAVDRRGAAGRLLTGCGRLIHADADGFPGLTVDRYGAHLVYQATTAWADRAAAGLVRELARLVGAETILARNDAAVRDLERLPRQVVPVLGRTPAELELEEAGVRRVVDPWAGHKTGLYLDQQDNHRAAAGWLSGRVLDLFSGEGGFALPLAVAGREVTVIEQSAAVLERAYRSWELNPGARPVEWLEGNAFEALTAFDREGAVFDGIVLDPPPFARHREEAAGAARGYKDLHRRALRALAAGGRLLTFSCSFAIDDATFEAIVREAAEEAAVDVRVVLRPGPAADHPEWLLLPESRYLKGLLLERAGD